MRMIKMAALALIAGAGTCAATASYAAQPYSYAVEVKTSFGTRFADCFTFDQGKLTFSGIQIPFAPAPTMTRHYYTAVSSPQTGAEIGFSIAFAGFKTGGNMSGKLHAVGANSRHNSYTVEGVSTPSCNASPASASANIAAYAGPAAD